MLLYAYCFLISIESNAQSSASNNIGFSDSMLSKNDVLGHGFDIRTIDPLNWSASSIGEVFIAPKITRDKKTISSPESYHFVTNTYEFEKEVLKSDSINRPLRATNSKAYFKPFGETANSNVLMVYTQKKVITESAKFNPIQSQLDISLIEDFKRLGRDITPAGFISRHGTHVAQEVSYGGLFVLRNSISKNDFIYSPYTKDIFTDKLKVEIKNIQTEGPKEDPYIHTKTGALYTVGGQTELPWFTLWENTVNTNNQIPIDIELTPIVDVLRALSLPDIENKIEKLNVLDSITQIATQSARSQISSGTKSHFFKKYSLRFKQEIVDIVKKSMGPVKTSSNDYTGDIFFGGFSKDEALLNTKPLIERGGLRLETLITDELVRLDKNVIVTIKPDDIEYGYMSVWDDTKKLFKSKDRKRLRVAGSEEAKTYYKDALLKNVQKTVTITSVDDHIYEVTYTMELVKETDLLKNLNTTYNYALDSELVAAAATGDIEKLTLLFARNANTRNDGVIRSIITNKQSPNVLNFVLDNGIIPTTNDLDLAFERDYFNRDYALILLETGARPKNNMIYKAVAYRDAPTIYALFREGAEPRNNDLAFALRMNYYPTVKALMGEDYESFEAGKNELLLAAENNDAELAQKFIELGATADAYILSQAISHDNETLKNVIIPVTEASSESLKVAASINDTNLFKYFIDKDATLEEDTVSEITIDNNNTTILDLALKNGGNAQKAITYAIKKQNKPAIVTSLKNKANPDVVFDYAVKKNDITLFEDALVTYNGDPEKALQTAVEKDKLAFAELILSNKDMKVNPNKAIDFAVENENLTMVELLVNNEGDPNIGIERAVTKENIPIVQYLISKGAETIDPSLIKSAVKNENLELSKVLIEEGEANANNAIVSATETANVDITSYLLDKGATADQALKSAMETKNEEIILTLMKNLEAPLHNNALSTAARKGNKRVIQYLISEKSFNPQEGVADAILYKQDDVLSYLLKSGAKATPNHIKQAIEFDNSKGLTLLLETGISINTPFENGSTALHLAVVQSDPENLDILNILLSQKAIQINIKNSKGETPLHLASKKGEDILTIIKLLVDKGADITAKNTNDETPIDYSFDKTTKNYLKKRVKSQ